MFQRYFALNSEFKRLANISTISKLSIFKNISTWELLNFKQNMLNDGFSDGIRVFFSTIEGKKPAAIISSKKSLKYLDRGTYPQKIDFIHLKPQKFGIFSKNYNSYMLNKNEVINVIEKNKELYTNRLNIPENTNSEQIYESLKNCLEENETQNYSDILGITLGFPKYSSIIFNLEKFVGIDIDLRQNIPLYKEKLLEAFNREDFPYKNLSKEQIEILKTKIESIKKIEPFHNAMYDFVKYVDEPEEIKRIEDASNNYVKGFRLNLQA